MTTQDTLEQIAGTLQQMVASISGLNQLVREMLEQQRRAAAAVSDQPGHYIITVVARIFASEQDAMAFSVWADTAIRSADETDVRNVSTTVRPSVSPEP